MIIFRKFLKILLTFPLGICRRVIFIRCCCFDIIWHLLCVYLDVYFCITFYNGMGDCKIVKFSLTSPLQTLNLPQPK